MKKALIIEDEIQLAEMMRDFLVNDGWQVRLLHEVWPVLRCLDEFKPDLIILDLMLGSQSGEELCQSIRSKCNIPIIIVTAKSKEQDRVGLLYLGADDYIVKPFSLKELVARAYAVMRRYKAHSDESELCVFDNGEFIIDTYKCKVTVAGREVEPTSTEFKLLSVMSSKPGKVFSRNDLIYYVLGHNYDGDGRSIDVHIRNIRRKIELNHGRPRYIHTVIGIGYKFEVFQ